VAVAMPSAKRHLNHGFWRLLAAFASTFCRVRLRAKYVCCLRARLQKIWATVKFGVEGFEGSGLHVLTL
jgi:hypothetical protein